MTNRENRRFLKREIAGGERLQRLVAGHPLMAPLMDQRVEELRGKLAALPPGGREPRTVLFFTGAPVFGSRGIDAQFAATVLNPFLEMVKTEYSAEKHGRVGERGRRKDEDEARLLLTGLPRGSFGLELSQPESEDLFAGEQLSGVLVRLTDLLSAAGKSDEEFVHALEDVSPRVYGRLPEFFRALRDNGANLRMQTGDLEFQLDEASIAGAVDRVSSVHTEESEEDVRGVFRGATLDTWRFDFRNEAGNLINGRVGAELSESQVVGINSLTNRPCVARLKVTKVTMQGGAVRTKCELLRLAALEEEIEQAPK